MHYCPHCNSEKPDEEFRYREIKGRKYPSPYCKDCTRTYQRERRRDRVAEGWVEPRRTTEENTRLSWLRRLKLLGITEAEYNAMLTAQDHRCAICRTDKPWTRSGVWAVDHDHATGKVRGLLCHSCNLGLGKFNDDIETLLAAAEYVQSHTTAQTLKSM